MKELTMNKISQALEWAYKSAITGFASADSAPKMAENFMMGEKSLSQKANTLINWQITKAGTTGFLTGLGGIITMPVTIPANLAVVLFVQIRMIAALAHMGGYDLHDERVQTMVYACLAGNGVKDIVKGTGIVIGTKLTKKAIEKVSGQTITKINKAVGFRLLTKFGQKGAINLGKLLPIVGGIIGGTFDSVTTLIIGKTAKKVFITQQD